MLVGETGKISLFYGRLLTLTNFRKSVDNRI